jgi:methyl halide transferase
MNLDSEYWDNRYKNDDFPWDIGSISPPLKKYFDELRDKDIRILIPGAGNSYEAEYLFENGFKNIFVLDISVTAVQNFKMRCSSFPSENILLEDFFVHRKQYDLIIEQTFFCAINPVLRASYVKKMHELLKPNGILAGLLFHDAALKGNPPFAGTKEEYLPMFNKYFNILQFDLTADSVKPRLGRELFIEVRK